LFTSHDFWTGGAKNDRFPGISCRRCRAGHGDSHLVVPVKGFLLLFFILAMVMAALVIDCAAR